MFVRKKTLDKRLAALAEDLLEEIDEEINLANDRTSNLRRDFNLSKVQYELESKLISREVDRMASQMRSDMGRDLEHPDVTEIRMMGYPQGKSEPIIYEDSLGNEYESGDWIYELDDKIFAEHSLTDDVAEILEHIGADYRRV